MTLQRFLRKYGTRGIGIVLSEFIRRAPAFPGDSELGKLLGVMVADLESALQDARESAKTQDS